MNILQLVLNRITDRENPRKVTYRIYQIGGGWGHHIHWEGWEQGELKQRVCGHLCNRPRIGDELRAAMQSGKIARFIFTDVEYMLDPPDMFFGTVEAIGYMDEISQNAL